MCASRVLSSVVCGDNYVNGYTMFISNDNTVYSLGKHTQGEPGQKEETDSYSLNIIPSLTNIQSIDCGVEHVICLDIDGNVFTLGSNVYGQLGICKDKETVKYIYVPQKVDISPIQQISCGGYFNICLSEDGDLFSFGANYFGQLGQGNNEDYNYPHKMDSLPDIDFIECGGDHSICKTLNNDIYVWGSNYKGQLGLGNNTHYESKFFKCTHWPDDIIDIKCGNSHTLVLTSKQEVYSCGSNEYGQIGRKLNNQKQNLDDLILSVTFSNSLEKIKDLSEIIRIACGNGHSMCIDIYNNLYVFGNNYFGQLGFGHTNNREHIVKHPSLSNIIDLSSRGHHTFVKNSSNEIYAFGKNNYSQLGIITNYEYQLKPIQVFQGNEDIWWYNNVNKSLRVKSARK